MRCSSPLTEDEPLVLTLEDGALLPSGPFETDHPTLQAGLRAWVERQTHHPLGYVEQLYTFADRDRAGAGSRPARRFDQLSRPDPRARCRRARAIRGGRAGIAIFPGRIGATAASPLVAQLILPRLAQWVDAAARTRRRGASAASGPMSISAAARTVERGAGAATLRAAVRGRAGCRKPRGRPVADAGARQPMRHDHRRILATGIARLRGQDQIPARWCSS